MHHHKELRRVIDALEAAGWETRRTRRGHYLSRGKNADGEPASITFAATDDPRGIRNIKALVRRNGVDI